jgi:hypothetical protein
MHIGVIGGLDRNAPHYAEAARAEGHSVEWHRGILAGRGGEALSALVERSDLIVIITEVNSHAGVLAARKLARQFGKQSVLLRKLGAARFKALLDEYGKGTRSPFAIIGSSQEQSLRSDWRRSA